MKRNQQPVPDLLLERFRLRELPADMVAAIERRLETDSILLGRLQALDESDAEIRARDQETALAASISARMRTHAPARRLPLAARWLVLATAVLLVAVPLWPRSAESDARVKGDAASLFVYRKSG